MDVVKRRQETLSLDTVRALHQTVRLLRTALDKSNEELRELRASLHDQQLANNTIEHLSLENHLLRRRALEENARDRKAVMEPPRENMEKAVTEPASKDTQKAVAEPASKDTQKAVAEPASKVIEKAVAEPASKVIEKAAEEPASKVIEKAAEEPASKDTQKAVEEDGEDHEDDCEQADDAEQSCDSESDNESDEELDDIELIFTTEDTKELAVLQEDLVSFADNEAWQTSTPQIKFQDADSFDEAAEIENEEKEKKVTYNLKTWTHSVFVETDISKCGVVDENEAPGRSPRRNTLPNPLVYQPIIHREVLKQSPVSPRLYSAKFFPSNRGPRTVGKSPVRPILAERNSAKRENEAQTDITALPSHWRSESYLAHKVSHNFTTLPSKFTLPVQQQQQQSNTLRLSDKTREARRTLLSDINFTSMVPELSRSADHLCREGVCCKNYPRAQSYMKSTTENLVSPGYFQSRDYGKDMWSPCDCGLPYGRVRSNWDNYQVTPRYRGSLTSMPSYEETTRRRHSSTAWRDSTTCPRPTYGSVPTSPTHNVRSRSTSRNDVFPRNSRQVVGRSRPRNRVTFHESSFRRIGRPGLSLPDLRVDLEVESGDSTDSLIDEAEEYLRRSIDSILTGTDYTRSAFKMSSRRYSNPDPIREFAPPKSAQPFLPKVPRDLKLDHLVKVINRDNRVLVGRVRYVGTVQTGGEAFVGVQLPTDSGNADGSCHGHRYFDCDPDHAVFVPFKKVIMAWTV